MKNILNKNIENKNTENKNNENKPRVVIASKLKITRDTFDKYGNLVSRREQ